MKKGFLTMKALYSMLSHVPMRKMITLTRSTRGRRAMLPGRALAGHLPLAGRCLLFLNPSDPDATYDGHKGNGYQVQLAETCGEDNDVQPSIAPVDKIIGLRRQFPVFRMIRAPFLTFSCKCLAA